MKKGKRNARRVALKPGEASAYFVRGNQLYELKQYEAAISTYDRAIAIKPDFAEAYSNRGVALYELQQYEAAVESYDRAIALKPDYAEAYSNRGNALQELRQYEAAVVSCDRAISLKPYYTEAWNNRGIALYELKQYDAAVASYDRAIALKPDYALAHYNRGNTLYGLKQYEAAVASYDRAIALKPDYAEACSNRGNVLKELQEYEAAVASYDCAIAIKPDFAGAYSNRGIALYELKQYEAALASYDRALLLKPDCAKSFYSRGNALQELKQYEAAVASYDRAVTLKPDDAEAFNNRGNALYELQQYEAAVASYDRAIMLKPGYTDAYYNRGNTIVELQQYEAALSSYGRAISLQPDYDFRFGLWLHTKMKIGDWSSFDQGVQQLSEKIEQNKKASSPFHLLALIDSPALHKQAVEMFAHEKFPSTQLLPAISRHLRHKKIRIGYFSADYRNHPVMYLMAELLEKHDREAFEVIAFSFGPNGDDEMKKRAMAAVDRFIDVRNLSDIDVATLSRSLEIDIAIDLGGFTGHGRTGIFALRAAPIQASYIGYLGTMGADYIDYLIADSTIIPEESRQHYCEKIVYLPSYQVNDTKRRIADRIFTREECGLPERGFVFCCFNNIYKITPGAFDGWMRILHRVENSVLFLCVDNDSAIANLKKEAESRGVRGDRLIFARRLPLAEYLARYRVADLFLDTRPYNAGATASDALWAGLPVLTLCGESFASRVAASLLHAIQLPKLITATQEEYETLAVTLAQNPEKLSAIRQKLEKNRLTTPLFDTKLFTRHIEAAYTAMYERYQKELPPEHIIVPSSANGGIKHLESPEAGSVTPFRSDHAPLSQQTVVQKQNHHENAVVGNDHAIALKPDEATAHFVRGNTLYEIQQYEAAVARYDWAIALKPDYAAAYSNRGVALYELKQYEAAVESYDRAIALKPDYADAYSNRGNALQQIRQYDSAVASCDRAISLKPDYAEAWNNRGIALYELKQYEAAVASYDRAIMLKPDYANAYSNRGNALQEIGQHEAAVASYDRAISLTPSYAKAWNNRGAAFQELQQYEAAIASYERAISLKPDYDFLFGQWLHTKMKICDWSLFDQGVQQIAEKIELRKKASSPFPLFALIDSPALHKHAAEIFAHEKYPSTPLLPAISKHLRHKKIRIGYYSEDYCNHPVMYLMAELFEKHDREAFEVIAFSFGPDKKDEMRKRAEAAFDRFIDVRHLSDSEVVNLSRSLEIDIAIDLVGFTGHCRTGIFALRSAPIQVNYLGYPGTMGMDYLDYLIADATLIPENIRQHFTEKIVSLPDSYMANQSNREVADKVFTREECGLPEKGFIFCCFNNNYKITPATFDSWMRILKKVKESVLWLSEDNPKAAENLRVEAVKLGVNADRLIFAKRVPLLAEHLARHRQADLFLDTYPYNAHTTASDALWAGLPVLTLCGESFASRVAASLLHAIQLPELITATQEEYEALAVALAQNPEKLSAIRQKLEHNRLSTPLFDTKLFTRHIEAAYTAMYERYQKGLPPEHIVVPSSASGGIKHLESPEAGLEQGASVVSAQATPFRSDHAPLLQQPVTLHELNQTQAKFQQAIRLHQSGQLAQAQRLYDEILQLQPQHIDSLHLSGVVASQTKNFHKAVELIGKAIELCPDNAAFHNNYGNTLKELQQYEAAVASYDRAILLKPDYAEAWNNRGVALYELRQYEAVIASYERAISLKPDYDFLFGQWLHTKMKICDWSSFDQGVQQIAEKIELRKKASSPFLLLVLIDSPALHKKAAEIFAHEKFPSVSLLSGISKRARHKKIRIGYYSADYHNHATAYLMAELFEKHDREKFELLAFSFGPDIEDEMRKRVVVAFDRFLDVRLHSDREVALLSRELEIDIAVDLTGFTQNSRTGIFAFRAAPIQVNYLGYPGTMGADYIDYLIADATLIPEEYRKYYTEKIVSLPDSYQVNDAKRCIAEWYPTRTECGLPEKGFVFCCFNNNYKITPATLDGWMRILKRVEGSVLWLLEDNQKAAENLRQEAVQRCVERERLIFVKRMPLSEHLARHRWADLFLDTYPCNAHTTASDALWAGLPVLTLCGESFASRVAASLLHAIQLSELITVTQEEYETLAVALAQNPEKLSAIRQKLEQNRLSTPLFDTKLFTRHIEAAYTAMYERYQKGLPPEHIVVPSSASGGIKHLESPKAGSEQGASVVSAKSTPFRSDHAPLLQQSAVQKQNHHENAVAGNDHAIALKPVEATAHFVRGNTLYGLKQYEAAVASYDWAIALKPDYAEAYSNRGVALYELQQYEAAVASYDQVITLKPDCIEAWNNRGNALYELLQYEAAVASYDRAIVLKPDFAEVHSNRGVALYELQQYDAAVASYDRAITLKSDYAEAWNNRGNALKEIRQYESAIASYERAISLKPDYDFLFGELLHTKMKICDWSSFDFDVQQVAEKIAFCKKASAPFPLLALMDSPVLHKHAAEMFAHEKFPSVSLLSGISKRARHKKIRIGYYSADYHNHATAYLMAELFEKHDREKFELLAFSFGPDRSDEMRKRSSAAFDRFLDVRSHSDREVALLSRELEIDIAVDLKGFTHNSRTGIFAFRAAPIQVNYLGYPGTMGADYIDYLIADATLIPEEYRKYYTEKIVSLPDSYQVNDAKRCIAEWYPTRTECGLPEKGFVFCCFNNNYKITPATLDSWMRILKRVEGSVLWLFEDNQKAADNLRQGAVQRGVERERLIFVKRLPLAEHLARHRRADLFLDTYPCNAHTTASDALWAGLPVLTLCGESFASRVAASLLSAIQLPELITATQEEYETLAVALAQNPDKLSAIRQKLEQNRLTTPLFDTKLFARHIEAAYTAMYERYHEGLPPEHIVVPPVGIEA